ncbi:MAG: hemolysin III family protein [Arenimonas sp.]|nr:hemolysin III family protein [Arenimonas sp.]
MTETHHDWREEIWNALTHGAGFLASLLASAVLITLVAVDEHSDGWRMGGALVFCLSLITVYTSSTLYHSIPHAVTKSRMKIFDHCAIFVLIAGTYTPFTLVALRGDGGWWLFGAAWALAVAGIIFKLFYTGRFKGVSTLVYIGMGWMAVLGIKPFLKLVPMSILLWLLAGGLAYTLGTLFYMSKRPHAHAIWHAFVMAGSASHFVAVAMLVLGHSVMPQSAST